jgi:outer membrane lipoprotein LolB
VTRWLVTLLVGMAVALAVSGCATPQRDAVPGQWSGRLSVRVESDPVQSFAAAFELQGDAAQGRLALLSPFGATLAVLTWSPTAARLQNDGKVQDFDSLAALTRQVLGADLPVAGIFAWLRGEPADLGTWITDGQDRQGGKLLARRLQPAPAAEMRLILD